MRTSASKLNAKRVETVKTPGRYSDGDGLHLRVYPSGAKLWKYRYQRQGKRHDMGLGPYPTISLAEARRKAEDARRAIVDGLDPLDKKRDRAASAIAAAVKRKTLREAAEAYITSRQGTWKDPESFGGGLYRWRSSLEKYAYPFIGDLQVASIDRSHIFQVLDPIWRVHPPTANELRGRLWTILDFAAARDWRSDEKTNPADKKRLEAGGLPAIGTFHTSKPCAMIPYAEIPGFLVRLRQLQDGTRPEWYPWRYPAGEAQGSGKGCHDHWVTTGDPVPATEFAILTAAREAEAAGTRWDELDWKRGLWSIPHQRTKQGRPHVVPLSPSAWAIIERMAEVKRGDFVFTGRSAARPLRGPELLRAMRRVRSDGTMHGFRAGFSTWAAEHGVRYEVAEAALGHSLGSEDSRRYNRSNYLEERALVMESWGSYCIGEMPAEKVVPLRRVR